MKKFTKILGGAATLFLGFGLLWSSAALAASVPPLGTAASFSVLGAAAMSSTDSPTTISGDLGLSPGATTSKTGTWIHTGGSEYFGTGGVSASAQTAALGAFGNLAGQTTNGGWGTDPWAPLPGVWTVALDTTFSGTITLNGGYDDVWVFQVGQDMTFTGSVVLAGNAQACHVFWQIGRSATIGSGSNFVGTLIAHDNISSESGATINGRLISLTGTFLAMNGTASSITGPTCAAAPSQGSHVGNINVVKIVINDNGGTKTVADFPLFVNSTPVVSGVTNVFPAPAAAYTVTETSNPNYTRTFSGDCDVNGQLNLSPGFNKFCIITNNDIGVVIVPLVPPLIDVVKVPSPLALPNGPGLVQYTYTLRNIGTVPVTNVTMVDDTCSPAALISGDTNGDAKLDVNETWIYTCSATLAVTHTNTVVATGWANGISAVDIANATVVVGVPVVPPLIHVTKIPSPLTLPAGGGWVTYTKRITNPGTVALSNIQLTDDKCVPIKYISGDTNGDLKLDPTETWVYTCRTNLTKTTTNTAIATGEANGLTARDFAIATVVVANAIPTLPNTGLAPKSPMLSGVLLLAGILILTLTSLTVILRKRHS